MKQVNLNQDNNLAFFINSHGFWSECMPFYLSITFLDIKPLCKPVNYYLPE